MHLIYPFDRICRLESDRCIVSEEYVSKESKQGQIRPYDACNAAAQVIGPVNVDGAQQVKYGWRIYIKSIKPK